MRYTGKHDAQNTRWGAGGAVLVRAFRLRLGRGYGLLLRAGLGLGVSLTFFLPGVAFAVSHTYNCATELTMQGTTVCSGATTVFTADGGNDIAYTSALVDPNFTWTSGHQYFFVVNSTGSTGTWFVNVTDINFTNNVGANQNAATTNGEFTITPTLSGGDTRFEIVAGANTFNHSATNANVQSVCVSDTAYSECLAAPAKPRTTLISLLMPWWW